MSDKLHIKNEMRQFDRKNRNFYNELTDEERKKFSNYLMIRWGSTVSGDRDLQEYYLLSTNKHLNKHFFAVNRHPKLQWLMATTVSPGLGTPDHHYIKPKKKETASNTSKVKKILMNLYPNAKMSDIELMSQLVTTKELKELLRDHGSSVED